MAITPLIGEKSSGGAELVLADFVVLADDPHTVEAGKIKDIKIVRTVVGGATAYKA